MSLSAGTLAELRSTLDALDAADLVKHALLAEIDRLSRELGECKIGYDSGTRAIVENLTLHGLLGRAERVIALRKNTGNAEYDRQAEEVLQQIRALLS